MKDPIKEFYEHHYAKLECMLRRIKTNGGGD